MTRTLILMRHAKSSWETPALTDHQRPLNRRGQRSAAALGRWLTQRGYLPDQVLSSDAERTRETWERTGLTAANCSFLPEMYNAGPGELLATLQAASGRTVLMLGHNPGVGVLAGELVAEPPAHARFADYPTGATTVMDFAIDGWSEAAPHGGTLRDFIVPRELLE